MTKSSKYGLAIIAVALATPAFAHTGHDGGFAAGIAHPLMGIDHVLAMLAVGLWAALRGGHARWAWPLTFVSAMAGGFFLAQANVAIPMLEQMIASTVILLGAAIALRLSAPIVLGMAIIALAGTAHGFAHGLEVQGALFPFASGFALATLFLHLAGLGMGLAAERLQSQWAMRAAGTGIAMAGAVLFAGG